MKDFDFGDCTWARIKIYNEASNALMGVKSFRRGKIQRLLEDMTFSNGDRFARCH